MIHFRQRATGHWSQFTKANDRRSRLSRGTLNGIALPPADRLKVATIAPRISTVWHGLALLSAWQKSGVWIHLHRVHYEQARRRAGRAACPSVVSTDGQLLKTTERGGARGFDAHKPVKDANATSWSTHSTYWASSFACSRGFSIAAPCTQGIRNRFLCLFQTFSPGVLYERAALDRD
jgi:hypothetical protein